MKLARPLLLALGVTVAVFLVVLGLAFAPAVQRWAVVHYAARQFGLQLEVASVSADPWVLTLQGVKAERRGVTVNLDRLDADYSLWAWLWSDRLQIDRLVARGLAVDATRVSHHGAGAGAVAAPAAVAGALSRVQLPAELFIGELEVAGRAAFAVSPGRAPLPADFKLTGGKLAPGREGTLRFQAHVTDPSAGARVTALDVQVGLRLAQSRRKTFERVGLTMTVDAHGPDLPGQRQLRFAAELARGATGENYRLRLDTVHDGQNDELLTLQAGLPVGQGTFTGAWQLTARTAQIEPFTLGVPLPKFDARGQGNFSYAAPTRTLALHGRLQGEVGGLATLQPGLRALGSLQISSEFDLAATAALARLDNLAVTVAAGKPVLALRANGVAVDWRAQHWQFGVDAAAAAKNSAGAPEFLRVRLDGLPLAWLRPFITAVDVSGGALTGEFALNTAGADKLTLRSVAPLAVDHFTVVRSGRTVIERASLRCAAEAEADVKDGQLRQVRARLRELALKTVAGDSVQAHAVVSAPDGLPWPLDIQAGFETDLPKLLAPVFPGVRVRADGTADFTLRPDRIEFRALTAEASAFPLAVVGAPEAAKEDKGTPFGSFKLTHAFAFDPARLRAEAMQPGGAGDSEVELAHLSIGRVPLGGPLRALAPGFNLTGTVTAGEFALAAQADKLIVAARAPLVLADASFARGGQPMLHQVTVQAAPRVELTGAVLSRVWSGEGQLRDATGAQLAMFTGEFTNGTDTGSRATVAFNLDLPAFAAQPLLARAEALAAGRASGEVRAVLGANGAQIEARATLNGLVAKEGGQALPVANLGFRAVLQTDGRVSFQMPLLLDRGGQRSDLNLSAEGMRGANGLTFDAKLTGERVELGDMLSLLAAAGESMGADDAQSAAAHSRALSPPAADERPFWSGVGGQLALDVKSVTQGKEWTMSGLTARVVVEPAKLQCTKIAAALDDKSRLAAQGTLEFTSGLDPYHLAGEFSLTEFAPSRFFKAIEPDRAPTIEGLFTVKGRLDGQGLTLDDTLDRTHGQYELTSRQGVFRGLKRLSDKISMSSKAVEIVGSLIGKGPAEKLANNAVYADQLAQELPEINYDLFSARLARDDARNLQLEDVTLVSPEIRLTHGHGLVTYAAGRPLLAQPLTLSFNLAVRGKPEQTLQKLGALDGTRDELGYAKMKVPIPVAGTPARPDPNELYAKLAASKVNDLQPAP